MVENCLKMNQEKTEFIAFGSSHNIEQLQVESIRVGNDPVEISPCQIFRCLVIQHS